MRDAREVVARRSAAGGDTIVSLQVLRFVAASMVLLHHLLLELATPRLAMPVDNAVGVEWSIGVDIFFIVSGFIMCFLAHDHFAEKGYPAEFLRRRFVRVVPLYWLFTSLMLLLITVAPGAVTHNDLTIGRIVSSYLFYPWPRAGGDVYPVLGLGWTLNYEILFYLCFSLALRLPRRLGLAALTVVFVAAATFGRFLPAGWTVPRFWSDPIIVEFLFGIGLALAYLRGARLSAVVRVLLVAAGFALSVMFTRLGLVSHIDRDLWGGAPALLIAAGAILGPRGARPAKAGIGWPTRLLVLGGDASYALYLSHMFWIRLLTTAWVKLHRHDPAAYLVCGMVLATLAAVAVYLAVERPVLGVLKRIVRPRPGVSA